MDMRQNIFWKSPCFCFRCSFFWKGSIKICYLTSDLECISMWIEWWRWDKFWQQKCCQKQTLTSEFGGNMPKLSRGQSICWSDHGIHKLDPVYILPFPEHFPSEHFTFLEHFSVRAPAARIKILPVVWRESIRCAERGPIIRSKHHAKHRHAKHRHV